MYLVESMKIVELITISIFQYPWNIPRFGNRLQAIWNIHKHFVNISWNTQKIFSMEYSSNMVSIWIFQYYPWKIFHQYCFHGYLKIFHQYSNIHQIFHQYSNMIHGTSGGFDGVFIPGCRWAALRIVVGDVTQTQVPRCFNGRVLTDGPRGHRPARICWMLHRKDQENYDKHLNHVNDSYQNLRTLADFSILGVATNLALVGGWLPSFVF